ncbi:MAG: dihydropteroate synthase-like protein [Methanotrichaceae archaeon]
MRILAVTGHLAEDLVKESAIGADVLVLDVDVASFITPQMLRAAAPQGYDLILIPGAITSDFSQVEKELNTKIRLGPKHAVDLGYVLKYLDEVELSTTVPACVLLADKMKENARITVNDLEAEAESSLVIKRVKVGGQSRMKVLAEIVDATKQSRIDLVRKVGHYQSQGADMIDLGIPLDAKPSQVRDAVKITKEATHLPVSVDTIEPDLILAGIKAGADLILSLNEENMKVVGNLAAEAGIPAVVIPGPNTGIAENVKTAQSLGIEVMADPVLNPPLQGMVKSAKNYLEFHQAHPEVPLFFGIGNVTELIDADSPGVNGLMAAIGSEVGASVLFTPEYSDKALGSIRELRTASDMMALARSRKSPPKDLGIDLLLLKEKRSRPEENLPEKFVEARGGLQWKMDPAGSFRIGIAEGKIVARHDRVTVVGKCARDLLNTLIDRGLVTRLDHAGYLGRELQKAELAIKLGRSYSQDESLF